MRVALPVSLLLVAMSAAAFTTDREYTVSHERLVDVTTQAIACEAHVRFNDIERTEEDGKTVLKAPYMDYSRVTAKIGNGNCGCKSGTKLEVNVSTDKFFYTRHVSYEKRLHEVVAQKLVARSHGEESKPTALPPTPPPPLDQAEPPVTPAPAPVK